jgi:transcription initiation factor TFIIIB Brf1 subunit/transcription initiation factor TFIIB
MNKELELRACKEFVCPNIGTIDNNCKELDLNDNIIKKAKEMAIEYLKKTYHAPRYSHIRYLLPSFVYLASILEGNKRSQMEIAMIFGITITTMRKWNDDIIDTLEL